jgi:hypothetical protein
MDVRRITFALAFVAAVSCDRSRENADALRRMADGVAGLMQTGSSCEQIVRTEGGPNNGGEDVYGTRTRLECDAMRLCSAGPDRAHHTADDQCVPVRAAQ